MALDPLISCTLLAALCNWEKVYWNSVCYMYCIIIHVCVAPGVMFV